jgi:hypothetical protein
LETTPDVITAGGSADCGAACEAGGVTGGATGCAASCEAGQVLDDAKIGTDDGITSIDFGGSATPPAPPPPDPDLPEGVVASSGEATLKGGTYVLRDPETGEVVRTGRTNDLERRELEHGRNPVFKDYRFEVDRQTDDYAEQRGREQIIHDLHQPSLNKIKPISDDNPRRDEYLEAGSRLE